MSEDDFTREQWLGQARWNVRLSNGEHIFQDDGRPGQEQSAWLRLAGYVREHNLKIEAMWLQFRNEPPRRLPEMAQGYFFRKSIGAFFPSGVSYGFYLVGHLKDGVVRVTRWKVPEMILVEEEARDPQDEEKVGLSLIRNY